MLLKTCPCHSFEGAFGGQVGATGAVVGIDIKASAIVLARKSVCRMINDTNLAWPSTPQGPARLMFERHNAFMPSRRHQVSLLASFGINSGLSPSLVPFCKGLLDAHVRLDVILAAWQTSVQLTS